MEKILRGYNKTYITRKVLNLLFKKNKIYKYI